MPRGPRQDAPGCVHHVMVRGIEGCRIFLDNADRLDFLERLEQLLPEGRWQCFAWAFMLNHVHLALGSPDGGLSRLMARLNTGYARSFNRRHHRRGYLFENRFKSRLVEDDLDLMGLVVYTHRNPLVAGLVDSLGALERYPWCGHSALVGRRAPLAFESIEASLSLFADDEAASRRRLRALMMRSASDSAPVAREGGENRTGTPIWPTPSSQEPSSRGKSRGPARQIEVQAGRDTTVTVTGLIASVSSVFGVSFDDVCSPCQRRAAARARATVAHLAVDKLGLPGKAVAATLRVSPSAVSHALRRGRAVVEEERIRLAWTQPKPWSGRS